MRIEVVWCIFQFVTFVRIFSIHIALGFATMADSKRKTSSSSIDSSSSKRAKLSLEKDIEDFIKTSLKHGMIEAVAGAGKTYALQHYCLPHMEGKKILYLAFNKHIVEEAKKDLPDTVDVKTFHSFAWAHYFANTNNNLTLKENLKFESAGCAGKDKYKKSAAVAKLATLAQNTLTDLEEEKINDLRVHHAIGFDLEPVQQTFVVKKSLSMLQRTQEDFRNGVLECADHDDSLWLSFHFCMESSKVHYDWIIVDEAQDLTPLQIEFLLRLRQNARIFVVGDSRQSIYSFRGASPNAMNDLRNKLNVKEFSLPECRRCPSSHIELAKKIVSHIEPISTSLRGSIRVVDWATSKPEVQPRDLVMSRNAKPIVSGAYECIRSGMPAKIVGETPLKRALLEFFKDCTRKTSTEEMQKEADDRLKRIKREYFSSGQATRLVYWEDLTSCIKFFIDTGKSAREIIRDIENIFVKETSEGCIQFSTIHRSKGSSAPRVWILIHQDVLDGDMSEEEQNLLYVALTRCKQNWQDVPPEQCGILRFAKSPSTEYQIPKLIFDTFTDL